MKKETNKKSKLWLWILLAVLALAIIGGVVAAFVLPGLMQQQGPTGPVAEAKLYWNLDRLSWIEEETNMSAREKAEDGYFYIRYAFDGKVEELKITDDKRLVNFLDSQDVVCLAFDENGIVVDCAPASTYFTPAAKDLYAKRVQGNMLQLNSSMAMNGMDMEFDISSIPVYEVAEGSEEKGALITPKWLDVVTIYNDLEGKPYAAYVTGHLAINAEVGWRVEDSMYAASTGYKRVPDKDGVYTIPFAINGEIVNRYIKDYDLAINIESQSMYTAYFALEYDEEGYIIDWENPAMALQGTQLCAAFNVDSITEDGFVTATRYLSGSNQGETVTFTYDDTCEIYQCCVGGCYEKHCGERIDSLQVGDMINVFVDLDGKPILIYVPIRAIDGPAYYNIYQQYSWTDSASSRLPNEDGYYVYEMAVNGGTKTVRTKSKVIADVIDSNHSHVVGLKLDGSVIKKVYGIPCVSGRSVAFGGRFVTSYNKPIVSVTATSDFSNVRNWIMADGCKIYTVEENYGVKLGTKSDIKVGEKVLGLMNARGELCYIYVQQSYNAGFKVGYNMARKYSTVTNSTTRVPDAEGYYVYDVAYNGEIIQLKTKNKAMADFIDLQNAPVFGFKEKDGIFTDVCTAASTIPYGTKAYNYNNIENMNGGILTSWYMSAGVKTLGTARWKITSKTKTYNVSKGYEDHPGEKTKPKVGDKIQALVNSATGEIEYIFVMNRPVDSPVYWMVSPVAPKYLNGVLVGSNRVPDEDGYYVFDLLHDGKIKQFKTKDEMIAAEVDTYTQGLGLKLKEGTNIIERVVSVADTKYPTTAIGNQDIKSIKGSTLVTERCRLTSSNYGDKQTRTIGKNVKIYDVSSYAENWGAPAKLKVGDRIVGYSDLEGKLAYIFITKAAAREKGSWGYCEHCGKTVFWDSYNETFAADGHYYLPADTTYTSAITFGSAADEAVYDQVFDLNGHTMKSTTSVFRVYDKLTIIDSVGGGMVTNGKGLSVGGTKQGGNIYVEGGTFTLLSGTITNGAVGLTGVGSNISAVNGTVNIKGGTVSGGVGYLGTAVYHSGTKGGINISGGKLAGSVFSEESKMITLSGAPTIEKLIVAPGNLVKLGALKKGANITVKADGIFTTDSSDINTIKSYFKVANSKDTITVSGKALKYNNISGELVVPEPESPNKPLVLDKNGMGLCVLCGETVKWTALREGDVIGDMNPAHPGFNAELFGGDQHQFHYYVAEDMTSGDGEFLFGWQGNAICLHLNGKTLNVRGGFYGGNGATVNIYGEGKVNYLANSTVSYTAGNMFEVYTANVNLFGGEYTSATNMIHGAGSATMLSISDEAIIKGNVKMDYGNVSISGSVDIKRIALGETAKLTISRLFKGKTSLSVAAGLEEGNLIPEANVAVLGKYTGKLTYTDFRQIVYKDGRLKVVGEAPSPNDALVLDENGMGICYVCGDKVQWIALRGGDRIGDVHSDGQSLHYYVAEDMTAGDGDFQFIRDKSANVASVAPVTICLHLNGKILNVKGVIESGHGCTTNIMGNGKVINSGTKEMFQSYTATLNIYGGEFFGGTYPVYKTLGQGAKINVSGDAKLYGNVELPYSGLTLKENARVDNIILGNTVVQKDINADGTPDDVTIYGKVTVAADWAGKAKLTVDAGNMDGKLIKAESGVALGDFTGVLINQNGKKFVNSDGMLQLTSKTGSIPAAPAAPTAPAVTTPPVPEGINDNLDLDSENKALCVHCGQEVVWTPIANGEVIGNPGVTGSTLHYYLTEDNTSNGLFFTSDVATGNNSVCLHLNGHNLTSQKGFTLQNSNKFNLMGNGTVTANDGMMFEIWTCATNIYGGIYNADIVMKTASTSSIVSVLGDVQLNGLVQVTAGRTYFAHNVSATKVDVSGTGKFQLANNWNGTMEISVADDLMEGNLVKKSAVELIGAVDGTITHASGVVTILDGQLSIDLPEPETPVWGVFNPEACDGYAFCEHCGKAAGPVKWTALTGSNRIGAIGSGLTAGEKHHIYLSGDVDVSKGLTQTLSMSHGASVCLHLNGNDMTNHGRMLASDVGSLAIMGDGNVLFAADTTASGDAYKQALVAGCAGGVYLYGGTYYVGGAALEADLPTIKAVGSVFIKDATVNGYILANTNSTITLEKGAVANEIRFAGSGKVVIADGWSGTAVLNIPTSDIVNNLIKSSRAVVNGDFTGTITLTDGRTVVKEGDQLKVIGEGANINDNLVLDSENKAQCLHCGKKVTWTPLRNGESLNNLGAGTHHVYLAEDVTAASGNFLADLGESAASNFNLCLHLNGHNVTVNNNMYCGRQWNINVMGNGKMINAHATSPIFMVYTCNVNLYGGTYEGANVVHLNGGGAKVYLHKNVNIQGKVTTTAGNLYVNDSASISNLEIVGGKLTIAEGWAGTMVLTVPEADIVDNLISTSRVVVAGDFTGTLKLSTGETLVNDNGTLKVVAAASADPVWGTFEPWKYGGRAYCEACGKDAGPKTWTVYDGSNYDEAHVLADPDATTHYHFYLDRSKEYSTANFLHSYENICFHLNGFNITATGTACSSPIYTTQRLCMMGEGIVTGGSSSGSDEGSVFYVNGGNASGSLKIYGGTYKKPATSTNPLLAIGSNGGKVYIYGGTFDVNDSTATAGRGNLFYVMGKGANKAVLEIHGGEFTGDGRVGSKETDAEFDGAATLKVLGGNVNGVISATNACEATLGGAAIVKEISVTADSKLTVKSDFTGKAAVSFESALVDNVVPAVNGVAEGGFAGFLSLADGRALVADGTSLKVPANAHLLKNLEFTPGTKMAVCPLCQGGPVEWTDITTKSDKRIGFQKNKGHLHLYLSQDMVGPETLQFAEIQGNTTVCFHLNGHNLTLSSRFKVTSGVCNILGRGNVIFEGDCVNTSATNQVLYNSTGIEASASDAAATVNIYGGNYAVAGAALEAGKPMFTGIQATSRINLFDVTVSGGIVTGKGTVSLDASAMIDKLTVAANGKLNVAGTYTGSVEASFASGLVADEIPAANGSSTGAFTGSVTLTDGTALKGVDGKLVKKSETT